jgi:LacI family transcriptional regulator
MLKQPSILLAFDWYDRRLFKGIVNYATELNWHISPYLFSDHNIPYGWRGDGAVTCYGRKLAKFIDRLEIPVVDISVLDMPHVVPRVMTDNTQVGRTAAQHFLDRGFRSFAYFTWSIVPVNLQRRESFFTALREAGIPRSGLHEICQPPSKTLRDWDAHQACILEQIRTLPRPLAVFTGQDNLAATLIEVCARNGIHVPEEVAVLGVDNIEFLCDCQIVPLSSIDTRLEDLGRAAAEQLHQLMDGAITNEAAPLLIPPGDVICRRSTDVLAVPHPAVVHALQFIKDRYGDPITLDDIAQRSGMSKRGIEKAFIQYLGRSPAVELRRCRLDNAKKMLVETNDKIDYIARRCGYSNSSNLSFALVREAGLSPRAYRRSFAASNSPEG